MELSENKEFYKFTNLSKFLKEVELDGTSVAFNLDTHLDEKIPTFVFIDGILQNPDVKVAGVSVTLVSEESVKIVVAKNAVVESPVRLLNLITHAAQTSPKVSIEAGMHSSVTIIEENIGEIPSYVEMSQTSVTVAAGATVEHIQIETTGQGAVFHGSTTAQVEKDATYRNIVLHISGKLNRRNLELNLNAPGAHGESFNLYLTNASEHSDINTVINHRIEDTTSKQLAKGILDGESKGIFTGKIHIFPQAQRVVSGQLNKNLLLSKKAQAHSQPQLEIFADDVKCSHGSTTGQLSPEEVFYFEARGIPSEKARTLLAHGFGLEVVMKIQNKIAQARVSSIVLETLKTKFQLGGVS